MKSVRSSSNGFRDARARLAAIGSGEGVPDPQADSLARLLVVLEALAVECSLEAMSIRCWTDVQRELGISPCAANGVLSEQGVPVACEVDTGSEVMMRLLGAAAAGAATVLDWNNNYGDDEDLCILFHCGNVPLSLMAGRGRVTEHAILKGTVGEGRSCGCNQGRLAPGAFTFGDLRTEDGRILAYLGAGAFTADPISAEYFGVAGVARIPAHQDVLLYLGAVGHRHHVALAAGSVVEPLREAMVSCLGYDVAVPQRGQRV